jgi:hypothetical protein
VENAAMGKPKGCEKTGGRQKGTPNHVTSAKAEAIADAIVALGLTPDRTSGLSPLDMMLIIAELRFTAGDHAGALVAAAAAAPFVHPKLTAGTLQVRHEYADKDDQALLIEAEALESRIAAVRKRITN